MPPAARLSDLHVCPAFQGVVPHIGGPILTGSPTVLIGGLPAARLGDLALCVGPTATIITGCSSVFINGQPAATMGDRTSHGGVIVTGAMSVWLGPGPSAAELQELQSRTALVALLDAMLGNTSSPEARALRDAVKPDRSVPILPDWLVEDAELVLRRPEAWAAFTRLVREGGKWDIKHQLKPWIDPKTGERIEADKLGNIHYGYLGRSLGFTSLELKGGAQVQGTLAGGEDPKDQVAIEIGMELYEEYGDTLTAEQLERALRENADRLR